MDAKLILKSLEKTDIIEDLLTPAPIVESGAVISYNFEWSNKFNQGRELFYRGNYELASQRFHELDGALPGHERILTPAQINESFCWLHLGGFEQYIKKWEPLVKLGRVYGVALWNLALAYYNAGDTEKAEECLNMWIKSPSLRFLAKAYLLLSVLQIRNAKMDEAITSLNVALKANRDYCVHTISEYLRSDAVVALEGEESQKPLIESKVEVVGKDEILSELEKLLVPRGPIRYPKLSQQLSEFEYQTGYITALEKFGDGDIDEALKLIDSLLKSAREKEALIWAKAAFLALKYEWSGSIKLVENHLDDPDIPGSVLWNASCSFFNLGNYDSALASITKCLNLEYRTSGITWLIKGLLAHLCRKSTIRDEAIKESIKISPKQLVYYTGVLRQIGAEIEGLAIEEKIRIVEVRDEELIAKLGGAIKEAQRLLKEKKGLQAAEQFIQFAPRTIIDIPEAKDITFNPIILPTCPAQLYDYKEIFLSGVNAFRSRGYEEAIQKFEELYSKTGGSYPAAVNLAASLIATEKYSRAIDILSSVIKRKEIGGAYAIRNLISALVRANKLEEAFPWFSEILETSSKEYFDFVQMAHVAQRLGRKEDIATALYNACTVSLGEPSIPLKGAAIKACIDVKDYDRAVVLVRYFTKEIQPPYVVAGVTRPAIPAKDCKSYNQMKSQYESFERHRDKRAALAYFSEVYSAREADYSASTMAKTVDALFNAYMFYGRSLFLNEDFEHAHEILRQALTFLTEHSKYYSPTELSKRYFALTNIYFLRKHYFWALELCERGLKADGSNKYLLKLQRDIRYRIEEIPERSRQASQELAELPLSSCKNIIEFIAILPKVSQRIRLLPQDFPESKKPIAELINLINSLLGLESIPLIQRKKEILRLREIANKIEGDLPLYLPKAFISALLPVLKGIRKGLDEIQIKSVCPEFTFTIEPVSYYREAEATLVCKLRNVGAADILQLQIKIKAEMPENWAPIFEEKSFDTVKKDEQLWLDWPIYFNSIPPPEEIKPEYILRFTGGSLKGEFAEQTFSGQGTKLVPFLDINVDYPVIALKPDENNKLYGRENLLRGLKNSFTRSGQTRIPFLEGVRKVGKTSILYFLAARLNGDLLPVYVNMDLTWENPFQLLAKRISDEVALRKGQELKDSIQIKTRDDFYQFVTKILRLSGIKRIVLLLDEFHAVIDHIQKGALSSEFLGDLRYMYMSPDPKFSVIFADWYLIDELKSLVPAQLWTDFARERVSFLSELDARSAILDPAQGSRLRFEGEANSRIYYYTAGYPWHIQWICSELINYLNIQKRYVVLPQDVEFIIKRLLKEDRLFNEGVCRPERLSRDDQYVLYGILEAIRESKKDICANYPRNLVAELRLPVDINHRVSRLIQLEILYEHENQLRFCSPLHALWLNEKQQKGADICLAQEIKDSQLSRIEVLPENLDLEIKRKCESLKELKTQLRLALKKYQIFKNVEMPHEWENATTVVRTIDTWGIFIKALRDLFVEDIVSSRLDSWEDRKKYPELNKELHSIRIRRNYVEHPESEDSRKEEETCCLRDTGKILPTTSDDWTKLQLKALGRLIGILQATVEQIAKNSKFT